VVKLLVTQGSHWIDAHGPSRGQIPSEEANRNHHPNGGEIVHRVGAFHSEQDATASSSFFK